MKNPYNPETEPASYYWWEETRKPHERVPSPADGVDEVNEWSHEEAKIVMVSAGYQRYWDGDNDSLERRLKSKGESLYWKIKALLEDK